MRRIFDPHTDLDCSGLVTGVQGKLACVRDEILDRPIVRALVQTPCKGIIEDFRVLSRDFYFYAPMVIDVSTEARLSCEADREEDPQVKDAREKLSSSQWILDTKLDTINRHLACQWNVDDGGSLHTTVLHPGSVASRDRRKRKAPDTNDDEDQNFNQRRKGRLLPLTPATSKSSGDSLWAQRGPHIRQGHAPPPDHLHVATLRVLRVVLCPPVLVVGLGHECCRQVL